MCTFTADILKYSVSQSYFFYALSTAIINQWQFIQDSSVIINQWESKRLQQQLLPKHHQRHHRIDCMSQWPNFSWAPVWGRGTFAYDMRSLWSNMCSGKVCIENNDDYWPTIHDCMASLAVYSKLPVRQNLGCWSKIEQDRFSLYSWVSLHLCSYCDCLLSLRCPSYPHTNALVHSEIPLGCI